MLLRVFLVCIGLTLSATVAAAQPAMQASEDPQLVRLRAEVRNYEIALKQAADGAGQKLAVWAQQVVPNVMLSLAAENVVTGLPLPDSSFMFEVRMAEIMPISLEIFGANRQRKPVPPLIRQGAPAQPVGNSAEPIGKAQGGDTILQMADSDPVVVYSEYVRQALIDALLDSSTLLPSLREGQWLSVASVPVNVAVTNTLYLNPSRKLILSIKAEDLLQLRQQKITRDQAKDRIVEVRF